MQEMIYIYIYQYKHRQVFKVSEYSTVIFYIPNRVTKKFLSLTLHLDLTDQT